MLMMMVIVPFHVVVTIGGGDGIRRTIYCEFHGRCGDGDACIASDKKDRRNNDYGHN
jgi:hypothetical protein